MRKPIMRMTRFSMRRRTTGFSLLEVLIAIVVLSFGLLGLALLQTISLRSGQSANYRTQATNLSYEIIDMIRANRDQTGNYNLIRFYNFTNVNPNTGNCAAGAVIAGTRWQQDRALWICAVRRTLPEGEGSVTTIAPTPLAPGSVQVRLRWLDDRGKSNVAAQRTGDDDFIVTSRL